MLPQAKTSGALALLLALGGCARETPAPKPPPAPFEETLVGYDKSRLLACAGAAASSYQSGGLEYLTYRSARTTGEGYLQSVPEIPVIGSLATGGKGHEIGCEATFVLKAGVVEALAFRTEPPQEPKAAAATCAPIVERCVPPR